jgi:hypothetical protein
MRTPRLIWLSLLLGLLLTPGAVLGYEPSAERRTADSRPHSYSAAALQEVCPGNRLVNPGFEGSFSTRDRNEIVVADGWVPWFKTDPGAPGINSAPEYKPEPAAQYGMRRIHSGNTAQKWFTTFATHTAGIFQQVTGIPIGSRLQFSAWVQVWSSDEDNNEVSAQPGNYRVLIGIDPTGGTDWSSENVVWSERTFAYDAYQQLSVATVARNSTVTVFMQGVPEFPVKHNDSYWDDACLVAIVPTNTPAPPTNTPVPKDTPTITPSPTETLSPTPSLTATETPTLTSTPVPTDTPTPRPTDTTTVTVTALPTKTTTPTPTAPSALTETVDAISDNGIIGVVVLLATAGLFLLLLAVGIRPSVNRR